MSAYWEEIKNNPAKIKKVFDYVEETIEHMKATDEESYWKAKLGIHEAVFGSHFNKNMAEYAVKQMKNVDGTCGEHWTLPQTNNLISTNRLDVNEWDFYYLMNMLYSDYKEILGTDVATYVKMALAYIDDPDADKGKVFRIWKSRFY